MRFISLIGKNENDVKSDNEKVHFYDKFMVSKYNILNNMYGSNPDNDKNYNIILHLLHPFLDVKNVLRNSEFIRSKDGKELRVTNAFMKMWEGLMFLDDIGVLKNIILNNTLQMFDVAGAPGMFVFAVEKYIREKYKANLDWYACSLESKEALKDIYKLYYDNPERYISCDVTSENDVNNVISAHKDKKFGLVTGDIGIDYSEYDKLQEVEQLDLEWGQMCLALKLVDKGGVLFLKMYSLITCETIYLLDVLSSYFDKVYITKPYTSKILNNESYIICIGRNDKTENIPIHRPNVGQYISQTIHIVKSFENARIDSKLYAFSFVSRCVNTFPGMTLEKMLQNEYYREYYAEMENLIKIMKNVK